MIETLIHRAEENGSTLSIDDIQTLLAIQDETALERLWQAADRVRQREVGDEIWLRGLVEFSNHCHCNCLYCGLRCDNRQLARYRLTPEEILTAIDSISSAGIGTVVLQSGEDSWWTAERVASLVKAIKTNYNIAVTLSIGDRPYQELALFREAGADRYLLRHETANEALYRSLHPGSILAERIEVLNNLKKLGYEAGTGCMVGLPGQTLADLAQDLVLARELDVEMFGVGPFIPHPETPLAKEAGGTLLMTYKMMALARLVMPHVNMPVTTALATLDENGRETGWVRGANVVMPNATPAPYREQYELYKNKRCLNDTLTHCRACLSTRIMSIGRVIGQGYGSARRGRRN